MRTCLIGKRSARRVCEQPLYYIIGSDILDKNAPLRMRTRLSAAR